MTKRFYKLKVGEQFDSGDGWDLLKLGPFTARAAHHFFKERFFFLPWSKVEAKPANPYCLRDCPCNQFKNL